MANTLQNKDMIFKYRRNKDGTVVPPKIFLCTRTLKRIGLIHPVCDLKIETKFNEANTCSFTIYKNNNGIEMPNFQRLKDLSVIEIEGFGLFEIQVTVAQDSAISKRITGTALQECELSQSYCTLEINTDYDKKYPTQFYRDLSTASSEGERKKMAGSSLLHRILSYAPTYSIGYVDSSLMGINREFSCSDTTVYDFLQEVAEEIGCIFLFDPMSRKINAYDLEDHCLECGGRHVINGVCQTCQKDGVIEQGYGLDTSIYVDTHTIAESIEDSVDVDSVKNCFKLVAGDDEMTNRIGQRLIGNSNYLWTFGEEQLAEFSEPLREKWLAYSDYVNTFQTEFNQCWDEYNKKINDILDLQSGQMPTTELNIDDTDPAEKCEEIYQTIKEKIQYYVIGTKNAVLSSVSGNILKFANFLCPPGYKVEFQTDKYGNKKIDCETVEINHINVISKFKCYLYIYLMDCKDENQKDKYYYQSDEEWEIDIKPGYNKMSNGEDNIFSNDYYLYLKQMMDYKLASLDITYEPKYDTDYIDGKDHTKDADYYVNYFEKYSIHRLISFRDAYDTYIAILFELDADLATNKMQQEYNYVLKNGTTSSETMYKKLTEKYAAFSECISNIIKKYTDDVEEMEGEVKVLLNRISEINQTCNIKSYLGEELYQELISFKREQVYENQNFTSNVTDESTLMDNVEEFILRAKEEIAKSCQFQHSVPISMSNLLTLTDFERVFDVFTLGNYIRTRINGELVKFRIISIPFDFEHIEQCEFTFSDALVGNQALKDFQKRTQKAQSLATSFDYVQKQSTANDEKISSFTEMFREGLDATKTLIMSADDVSTLMDGHGILTRKLNLDTGDYYPEQLRITNGTIGYTDDDWKTIKAAFGRFYWNGEYRYGLIGESIVGRILAGENLIIENKDKSVKITEDGIEIKKGTISWGDDMKAPGINDINQLSDRLNNLDENIEKTANDAENSVSELNKKVAQYLTAGGSTTIGENYIISPYIGGGYLNIADDNYSVEIDPGHDSTNTLGGYLFCIRDKNKNDDNRILSVDTQGKAYFKGTIYATNGEFTGTIHAASGYIGGTNGWTIGENCIYNGCSSITSNVGGIYLGTDGFRCYNSNNYSQTTIQNGKLTCINGEISGKITANSGSIGGWKISKNAIYKDCESMTDETNGIYLGTDGIHSVGSVMSLGDDGTQKQLKIYDGQLEIYQRNLDSAYRKDMGITIKNDYIDGKNNPMSCNIRSSYMDFYSKHGWCSVGYIEDDIVNSDFGFYLMDNNACLHGFFKVSSIDDYQTSTLSCDYINTNEINSYFTAANTDHSLGMISMGMTDNVSYLYVGDSKYEYRNYINNMILNASSVHSNGTFYTPDGTISVSDKRLKTDITDIDEEAIDFILNLQPKKYKLKNGTSGRYHYGLVAQDVEHTMFDTIGDAGILVKSDRLDNGEGSYTPVNLSDENTYNYGLRYEELIAPMIKTIQKLNTEIQELKGEK